MSFGPATLAARFRQLEGRAARPRRFVVALSGGMDSTALAHAVAALRDQDGDYAGIPVAAIHVDHGLQAGSADWRERCASFAAANDIEFRSLEVSVPRDSGKGLEAAARDVRYAALLGATGDGDWLLSGHHQEDQSETLLLNLIRGSGPAGIAGIAPVREFGRAWLLRPLLDVSRSAILEYARAQELDWIEDPSNADCSFDRNFLRHEILPRLGTRWPDVAVRLRRSAGHAGEASQLLLELARIDLDELGANASRLPIDGLLSLSRPRQRNLVRYALRELGLTMPSAAKLERILTEVIPARADAQPELGWPGASIRRYRNGLYLLPEALAAGIEAAPIAGPELDLGDGLGTLELVDDAEIGLARSLVVAGITVRPRVGGERFKPEGQSHTRKLKKLLQEEGVVPWMRDRLPLIYSGDELVAVGDLWLAAGAASRPGIGLRWTGRPALH